MVISERDTHVPDTVRQLILEALHSTRFNTVREVVSQLKVSGISQAVTLRVIKDLANEGKVVLNLPGARDEAMMAPVANLNQYFRSTLALDFWATLLLSMLGLLSLMVIPIAYPIVIVRWVFSGLLLVFIPGFAFVRCLFPFDRFIDHWERLALSLGLSIALAILVAFVLNFTPWGITPLPTATGLVLFSLLAIVVATYRRARLLIRN